jgi:hypothetical protein
MTEFKSEVGSVHKAQCAQCAGERNCDVRGHHRTDYSDGNFWGRTDWLLLQCRGCDYVFCQTDVTTSEDYDYHWDENGEEQCEQAHVYDYWPALSKRRKPDWMGEYGIDGLRDVDALDTALVELYGALNANLPMLAAIGIRTAFDVAGVLLKVDGDLTFAKKLDSLVQEKHIREVDRSRLETAVDAGSASAHRGWKPSAGDLSTMMTILENFIFDTFVQPYRRAKLDEEAAKVRSTVPIRLSHRKKRTIPPPESGPPLTSTLPKAHAS